MRQPSGPWSAFLWRFVPLLVAVLCPWPGLARGFSGAFAGVCNAFAGVDLGWDAEVRFVPHASAEHPWWVLLHVTNVLTGQHFSIPVDTRTAAYIRLAVFVALAVALPIWKTRRGLQAVAGCFAILVAVCALTVAMPLLQILGMVHVLALGVRTQSALSIGILTLLSYPSMAFAIPGLVWLLTMRLAAAPGDAPVRLSRVAAR